jgi:hypothetical protein
VLVAKRLFIQGDLVPQQIASAPIFRTLEMNDLIDDEAFSLGLPPREEMYKQQCMLLEVELAEAYTDMQNGHRRIAQLVVMIDPLTRERDALQAELALLQDAR